MVQPLSGSPGQVLLAPNAAPGQLTPAERVKTLLGGAPSAPATAPLKQPVMPPPTVLAVPPRLVTSPLNVAPQVDAPGQDPNEQAYQAALANYKAVRAQFQKTQLEPYWAHVQELERARLKKPVSAYNDGDFVSEPPPTYDGPKAPRRQDYHLPPTPEEPSTIPVKADFIAAAKADHFSLDFLPDNATDDQKKEFEANFRKRYAQAGIARGLTADQMLGIYAFETGGVGTYDMQAGLEPGAKKQRQISTAIGYGQLLAAKSVDVIVQRGDKIAACLDTEGNHDKARLVLAMRQQILAANSGQVPSWDIDQKIAKTPLGRGVHAANFDLDIGPHLQAEMLRDTIDSYNALADKNGIKRQQLTGAMLQMMSLTGVDNGFQMLVSPNRLNVNFFQQNGYEANPVAARTSTAAGLLAYMQSNMNGPHSKTSDYLALADIFGQLGPGPGAALAVAPLVGPQHAAAQPGSYVDEPAPPPVTGDARIQAGANVLVVGDSHLDPALSSWNGSVTLAQDAQRAGVTVTNLALAGSRVEVWTGHYHGNSPDDAVFNERYAKLVQTLEAARRDGRPFSHVVVELGTNDEIWHGKFSTKDSPEIHAHADDVRELLALVRRYNANTQVLWVGPPRLPMVGNDSRFAIWGRNGGTNEVVRNNTRQIVEGTPLAHFFPSYNHERQPLDRANIHLQDYTPWVNEWWNWATGGQRVR